MMWTGAASHKQQTNRIPLHWPLHYNACSAAGKIQVSCSYKEEAALKTAGNWR